ncbi:MAG: hypothetical protein IJ192_13150, partial [Clostridia bacterium]|nr:hypothetical protein [Clostridia bacterium]
MKKTTLQEAINTVITTEMKEVTANSNAKIASLENRIASLKATIARFENSIKDMESVKTENEIEKVINDKTLTSLKNQLHTAISSLEYAENSISEIKDIEATYTHMLNGKEIIVTVKDNSEKIIDTAFIGVIMTEKNSTYALKKAYEISNEAVKKVYGIHSDNYNITCNYNLYGVFFDGKSVIESLARCITKRTALNMIMREGTKTQYSIYYATCRNDFEHHDTADMYMVAVETLLECINTVSLQDLQALKKEIIVLEKSVDMLKYLNPIADYNTISRIVASGKKYSDRITSDYHVNKRIANILRHVYKAGKSYDVDEAKHAAYLAVNNYLTAMRSIRVDNSLVSINSIAEYYNDGENEIIERFETDSAKLEKRKLYLNAFKAVKNSVSKSAYTTFKLLIKGYTVEQIASKRKINHGTVCKHKNDISTAFLHALQTPENAGMLNDLISTNVIVLDFEKALKSVKNIKKIEVTTAKNAEITTIRNAVNDRIKATFKAYEKDLKGIEKIIYESLVNGLSVRDTAIKTNKAKSTIDRRKQKIQNAIISIIENESGLEVDKNKLQKMPL